MNQDMGEKPIFQGSLFASGFLNVSIADMPEWQDLDDEKIDRIEEGIRDILAGFPVDHPANESQTEDDLIWPVLGSLGWTEHLRQQNLSSHGRDDVPDGLLFADKAAKERANRFPEEWKRYQHGLAIVESKRWLRPLDRRSGRRGEETAPSTHRWCLSTPGRTYRWRRNIRFIFRALPEARLPAPTPPLHEPALRSGHDPSRFRVAPATACPICAIDDSAGSAYRNPS